MRIAAHARAAPLASRANWLLAIPAVVVTVLSLLMLWPAGESAAPLAPLDLRCIAADRAAVTRASTVLADPGMRDARRLDRAVHGLITARTHCGYGWLDRALDDYAAIEPTATGTGGRAQ